MWISATIDPSNGDEDYEGDPEIAPMVYESDQDGDWRERLHRLLDEAMAVVPQIPAGDFYTIQIGA